MPQPFAIEARLTPEHLVEFHELLNDRRNTLAHAHGWLHARGYRISLQAVSNYRAHFRRGGIFHRGAFPVTGRDADLRAYLGEWAKHLSGDNLRAMLTLAAFLLNLEAARRGVPMRRLPGLAELRWPGFRTGK